MASNKPTVDVNGIAYRWPLRPVVVVCIDGGDPAYLRRFLDEGAMPNIARFIDAGLQRGGRRHDAELHLPEQHVDHHRHAGVASTASRATTISTPRTGEAVVMTGPELLRGDTILSRFAAAGAQGGLDHRQGQAAQAARQGPRRVEGQHQLLLRVRGRVHARRERHRERARARRHAAARHVLDGAVAVRARGRHQAAGAATGPTCCTSRSPTACSTSTRPSESEARRFYQELDERFGRLAELGAIGGAHRRPRHERQVERRRQAQRDLAAGHPRREVRQGRHARDLPDHRCLRRATTARSAASCACGAQGKATPRAGDRRDRRRSTASRRCSTSETACRVLRAAAPTARATWW